MTTLRGSRWPKPGKRVLVSWIKAALKEFETFPEDAQSTFLTALTIAADGSKADIANPMHGLGSGVFENRPRLSR